MRAAVLFLVVCLTACPGPTAHPTPPPAGSTVPSANKEDIPPEAATGRRTGMVATVGERTMVGAANPHASRAGREMLLAGGSAVDASVAMALVLTLVEPQSSGIGGGAFMLRYDGEQRDVVAYDGRETAPALATGDMFMADAKPRDFFDAVVGGLSVGVPGEVRMLEMAHQAHGKLQWKRLFEPAIRLATEGFEVSTRLFGLMKRDPFLAKMAGTRAYFLDADGEPKAVGTKITNPDLAEVFRQVADGGSKAFYEGPIAADIAAAAANAKQNPGRLRASDLASYQAKKRPALCRPYRKYTVCGMPPPTSGGVTTLQILGLLERFDMAAHAAGSWPVVHLFSEASRLAYADRGLYLGDPDFVKVPVSGLLDRSYLEKRSATISLQKRLPLAAPGTIATPDAWAPDLSGERPSTSHMVVVDAEGNAVSMTASIEGAFGSHVMVRGFLLNNELTDFSFIPEDNGKPVANRVQPGKRPRSSMAPIIVLKRDDRSLFMAVGSPGGSRIIGYVTRVLVDVLDHGLPVQQAISRPHYVNRNGDTELEDWPAKRSWVGDIQRDLEQRGHRVKVRSLNSGLHAIQRGSQGWVGAADPRREGLVLAD